ncbi:MAG: monovalent cation:H+ antiporter-2, family [Gammaproteobacteria bacterium]|jgi:CPA2 family monovalent cation:H+ antiporter-2|nr:monovalent cation:H+ antiporter-2, family [Gammaproteobacteria bacterium]
MGHSDPLLQILILLAASVCVVAAARKLALPAILGYLAVGMLLGPHALALAAGNETTQLLADFGVVFLVFTLGLEFSLPRLVAMRWEVLGVGGAQVLITTGLVAAIASVFFNVAPAVAVVVGGAVAMSSTAIIIAQLTEQSENNRTHGRIAVAICLFQDLSFPLLLALVSALSQGGRAAGAADILSAIGIAALALLLVLAAGRWLLRPLFLMIASVRSAELFSLAVLLAVLASAWATRAAGLSLALGAFLAGMMLAETEFRHQVEATIRSYREVLLGLFFITVGMLLNVGLLLRDLPVVMAILMGMLLLKAAVVAFVAEPATKSWFKSLRTGVVVAQGGEFGFALLILVLRRELLDPAIVQPLLAATVLSMGLSPLIIRHNRRITRIILRESGNPQTEAMRQERMTLAVAGREHVVICGFGRVGQNIARVLEQTGFEYIALDVDPYRIRVGRQVGDPVVYGDAGEIKVLENVGVASASVVVITFANPDVALRILRSVRELRPTVPILVRTQDDTKLKELQAAGATEVVPETFEASLMLLSHLLLLVKLPVGQVIRTVNDIRSHRYSMLRQYFRAAGAEHLDESHAFREELHSVILPPQAWAVGRSITDLAERGSQATVNAVRRDGIVGREPSPDTVFKEGDVVVVYGTPEAVEHAETLLLMG